MIRVNPLPWLFAPGIGFAGYLVDGATGATNALVVWTLLVMASTLWVMARRWLWPDEEESRR